jgi:CBS domain containing-hemolysin-like protein
MVLWLTLYVRPMSVNASPAFRRAIASDWIWSGIVACIVQSALFSGLNLAVFSLALLRLQIEADGGNADAAKMALGRQDKAIAGTNSGANVIRLAGFLVMTI